MRQGDPVAAAHLAVRTASSQCCESPASSPPATPQTDAFATSMQLDLLCKCGHLDRGAATYFEVTPPLSLMCVT